MEKQNKFLNALFFVLLCAFAVVFLFPVAIVLINSFKTKFNISTSPFSLPLGETFAGIENYLRGLEATDFLMSLGRSLFITPFPTPVFPFIDVFAFS